MELEVIWAGRKEDGYLCIPQPRDVDLSHVKPMDFGDDAPPSVYTRHSRGAMQRQVLAVLKEQETPITVRALRAKVGACEKPFGNLLSRMKQHGLLEQPQYGMVQAVGKAGRPRMERTSPLDKQCSKCSQFHSATMFWKLKRSPDGLQAWCRRCQAEANVLVKAALRSQGAA